MTADTVRLCEGQITRTSPYIAGVVSVMHATPCTAPSVITVDGQRLCKDCYAKMEMPHDR